MTSSQKPEEWSLASRKKAPSPIGTSIFVGLRSADVALQYAILQRGWGASLIETLGGRAIQATTATNDGVLGLTPYAAIISAMALGSTIKQLIYLLVIAEQEFPPAAASVISVFNTFLNSTNTLLSLWVVSSAGAIAASPSASIIDVISSSPTLAVGVGLYVLGNLVELGSETQRKIFKSNPENKGKPYGGGLFSLATNINYGGYTLWRTGYAITAAGWGWGIAIGALFFYDFTTRAIPVLDKYCTEKVSFTKFPFHLNPYPKFTLMSFADRWTSKWTVRRIMAADQEASPISTSPRYILNADLNSERPGLWYELVKNVSC